MTGGLVPLYIDKRFNPYHDPHSGRFTTGGMSNKGIAKIDENNERWGVRPDDLEREIRGKLTPDNIEQGKRWYPEAKAQLGQMGAKYGATQETASGVASALSPRLRWVPNMRMTDDILRVASQNKGMSAEDIAAAVKGPALTKNKVMAARIARGESVDTTLTGPKRRAFFNNLTDPEHCQDVTVDTWMQRAAMHVSSTGMNLDQSVTYVSASPGVTKGLGAGYAQISNVVQTVAESLGLQPHEVQAAYWIATRGAAE